MTYDTRGLTTQVTYTPPTGTTVPDTPTTVFTYDNLGNRTSMDTAGVSATAYSYDELSRLTAETVDFDDLTSNYSITYGYEISGGLKTVTDPFGDSVSYNNDKMGRTNSITGSSFGGVTTYAENIKFRAFGGLKEMEYGSDDSSVVSYGYDDRLRIDSYQATSSVLTGGYVRKAAYEYYADGHTKEVDDQMNDGYDQKYTFGHTGRLATTESGLMTSNTHGQVTGYEQEVDYDAFGHITSRDTSLYGESNDFTASYTNGRKNSGTETYDALGNVVADTPELTLDRYTTRQWEFDASGQLSKHVTFRHESGGGNYDITHKIERLSDGDGLTVRQTETRKVERQVPPGENEEIETVYSIRSGLFGGAVLTELHGDGTKKKTKVFTGNDALAEQLRSEDGQTSVVIWKHKDLVTGGFDSLSSNGARYKADEAEFKAEFEPLGAVIPESDPYMEPGTEPMPKAFHGTGGGNAQEPEEGCMWDGFPILCDLVGFATHSSREGRWEVNTRTPGGYQLQSMLQGALWRYDQYCEGDCGEYIGGGTPPIEAFDDTDIIKIDTNRVYINSFYVIYGSDLLNHFTDTSVGDERPMNDKELRQFRSARDRALDVLENNKNCRNAIADILKNVSTAFLPDATVYGRDGSSFSMTPTANFIFDSATGNSGYLETYDQVTMTASGKSVKRGNSIVYGVTQGSTERSTGTYIPGPIIWNNEFFSQDLDSRALSVLHEIIHQWATDIDIANHLLHPRTPYTNTGKASNDWTQILGERCGLKTDQRSSPGETVIR